MKIKTLKLARSVPFCGFSRDVWNADAQFSIKMEGEFFVLKSTTSSESLLLPANGVICAVIEQEVVQAPVEEKVIVHTPVPSSTGHGTGRKEEPKPIVTKKVTSVKYK